MARLGYFLKNMYISIKLSVLCTHSLRKINYVFKKGSRCFAIIKMVNDVMRDNIVICTYNNMSTESKQNNQ